MRKFIWRFLVATIIALLPFASVFASVEDFTTWTEVDEDSDITVTSDNITWSTMKRDAISYVYYDFGVDFWDGDFAHDFDWEFTQCENGSGGALWALTNDLGTVQDLISDDSLYIYFYKNAGTITVIAEECNGGVLSSPISSNNPITDLTYYYRVWRDEDEGDFGKLYCERYQDAERTILLGTISTLLTEKQDFRYILMPQNYGVTGSYKTSGWIGNLDTEGLVTPEAETLPAYDIGYDADFDYWYATLSGNVTDDGGESCVGSFYYRIKPDGEWYWANATGTYETGETFSSTIYALDEGVDYEYYARVTNSFGYDDGESVEFTTNASASSPVMQTVAYPIALSSENLSAKLYGRVLWDGDSTSNVTGWIQYKESDSEVWSDSTENVTDLISGDLYSCNITGLSLYTYYNYRASGLNDEGSSNASSYHSFYLGGEVTNPAVTTDNTTLTTDTFTYLYGTLTNDGYSSDHPLNGSTWAYFQYRIQGTGIWGSTSNALIDEGESYTNSISGLVPNTTYEYRAVARNSNVDYTSNYGYGDTKLFTTYSSITTPIMSTDNVTWSAPGTVRVKGTVVYDGGSPVTMWFQYRTYGSTVWVDTEQVLPPMETGETNWWYVSGLENSVRYQVRSAGQNYFGTGYGNTITFQMTTDVDVGGDDDDDSASGSDISTFINDLKESLGLTGTFGTWAFMGMILLIVALVFGIAMYSTYGVARMAVGVAWLLSSICVLGAFIFTGQLGIWPIVILVGGIVGFGMIILGVKFSGGGGGNEVG